MQNLTLKFLKRIRVILLEKLAILNAEFDFKSPENNWDYFTSKIVNIYVEFDFKIPEDKWDYFTSKIENIYAQFDFKIPEDNVNIYSKFQFKTPENNWGYFTSKIVNVLIHSCCHVSRRWGQISNKTSTREWPDQARWETGPHWWESSYFVFCLTHMWRATFEAEINIEYNLIRRAYRDPCATWEEGRGREGERERERERLKCESNPTTHTSWIINSGATRHVKINNHATCTSPRLQSSKLIYSKLCS